MRNFTTIQQLNENNSRETYWDDDRETVLFFANGMYQMKQKQEAELKAMICINPNNEVIKMLSQVIEGQNSIKEDVSYVKHVYTIPNIKKVSKLTETKLEKKAILRHRILNPRG
ncbi:hypothetical protein [Pedobacter agri]|uniref:hypothetical protein n=1 Tax=Pedobacter agri TaxID=454586 RepID=UPI00293065CC|nr:hypothetical protein [Pedobacter agri]